MTDRQLFLTPNFSKTQSSLSSFDDPTYFGFKPFFYFAEGRGLLGDEEEVNTAANYLKINKRTQNLQYLNYFKDLLSKISSETPYIFLSISGLNNAIFTAFEGGVQEEREITISCRMTIDRRVEALMQLYRLACFDQELYRREVVPKNLRQFSMGIYMTEFGGGFRATDEISSKFHGSDVDDLFLKNHFFIELGGCEFSLNSGLNILEDVSNVAADYEQTYDIGITFQTTSESAIYRGITAENKITSTKLLLNEIGLQTLSVGERPPINQVKAQTRITSNSDKTNSRKLVQNFINEKAERLSSEVSQTITEINANKTFGEVITDFEKSLIEEASRKIGRKIDDALLNAIFGNLDGISLLDIKDLVREAQGGDVSYVFQTLRNVLNSGKGLPSHLTSLGNGLKYLISLMSDDSDEFPSLQNRLKRGEL